MRDQEPDSPFPHGQRADLPMRRVTVNSIVALNLAYFRKAAGLTQEELGERIGWGKSVVSTAERSWDAKRVRSFSAEDLMGIAMALGIPVAALFLPPDDDGTAIRYLLDMPGAPGAKTPADLLTYLFPAHEGRSAVMDAYQKRLMTSGAGRELADLAEDATAADALEVRESAPLADAAARAEALERDAQEKYRQVVGSLPQIRDELERRVNDLRAFEREYRTRLQAFLESQLKDLWAGVAGLPEEHATDELRKRVAKHRGQRISAVMLREDGTYDVLQFGHPDEGGTRVQDVSQAAREGGAQ